MGTVARVKEGSDEDAGFMMLANQGKGYVFGTNKGQGRLTGSVAC